MGLNEKFLQAADTYQDYISDELIEEMKKRDYVFTTFSWINDSPRRPSPSWRSILRKIGTEDDIEGTFVEKNPAFTVAHIGSGITVTGNGSVSVMAELWIALHDVDALPNK